MDILRDQRWRMGGCLAAWLVYRKLLYGEASQPVVGLSPIETDEEREREHSCCQLFPVTVDCAKRTGHTSLFSSYWKNDAVLSSSLLSCTAVTENWHKIGLCIFCDARQHSLTQQRNLNIKAYKHILTSVSSVQVTRRESYLSGNMTFALKLGHPSNDFYKSESLSHI